MDKNTTGIIILVVAAVFILILRGFMGKSKAGSEMLKVNDGFVAFKFIMFLLLLVVGYLVLNHFGKKQSDENNQNN